MFNIGRNIGFLDKFVDETQFKSSYENFVYLYKNSGYAYRIINAIPKNVWSVPFFVKAMDDQKMVNDAMKDVFNTIIHGILERYDLQNLFLRTHQLSRIGSFVCLMLRFKETRGISLQNPPALNSVFNGFQILTEEDVDFENAYGKIQYYVMKDNHKEIKIHPSRIIHICQGGLNNPWRSMSVLQPIKDTLYGIMRTMRSAEKIYFLNARGGLHLNKVGTDTSYDRSKEEREATINDYKKNTDDYAKGLKRVLHTENVSINPINHNHHNPDVLVDTLLNEISSATQIPKNILKGSETGVLSSEKDDKSFFKMIIDERLNFCERVMLRPFVKRLVDFQLLPNVEFEIVWNHRKELSEMDATEVLKRKTEAFSTLMNGFSMLSESNNIPIGSLIDEDKLKFFLKSHFDTDFGIKIDYKESMDEGKEIE